MTEQEAKDELFRIHFEYMMHTPKERLKLYDEYQRQRSEVKYKLAQLKMEKLEKELKKK